MPAKAQRAYPSTTPVRSRSRAAGEQPALRIFELDVAGSGAPMTRSNSSMRHPRSPREDDLHDLLCTQPISLMTIRGFDRIAPETMEAGRGLPRIHLTRLMNYFIIFHFSEACASNFRAPILGVHGRRRCSLQLSVLEGTARAYESRRRTRTGRGREACEAAGQAEANGLHETWTLYGL